MQVELWQFFVPKGHWYGVVTKADKPWIGISANQQNEGGIPRDVGEWWRSR